MELAVGNHKGRTANTDQSTANQAGQDQNFSRRVFTLENTLNTIKEQLDSNQQAPIPAQTKPQGPKKYEYENELYQSIERGNLSEKFYAQFAINKSLGELVEKKDDPNKGELEMALDDFFIKYLPPGLLDTAHTTSMGQLARMFDERGSKFTLKVKIVFSKKHE